MSFKILFMGTPKFAVPILKSIYDSDHKVLEVYTQPPQKKNRGQKIGISPVHEYSNKINIPDIKSAISFFLSNIILKKTFHLDRNEVVKINITVVHKHLCTTNSI